MNQISLTLPYPISANRYWATRTITPKGGGRPMSMTYVTPEAKEFKSEVELIARARGEECTLRFPCCNHDSDTVVWCHSNSHQDGKGAGLKARDEEGCYGCHACHAWLDGGYAKTMKRTEVDGYFYLARVLSQEILRKKGLL